MDSLIKTLLIFLILYCPVAFGAVHIFSFTLMEVTVMLLLAAWLLGEIRKSRPPLIIEPGKEAKGKGAPKYKLEIENSPLNYPGLIFIGFIIFQLIPWPSHMVRMISPGIFGVYEKSFDKIPSFLSLSLYPWATKIGLYKALAYFGVFFLVINWADSKDRLLKIIYALIMVGIFESIYGLLESLGGHEHIWWYKKIWNTQFVTGTYINRNHLAGLLEIVIPIAFGLFISLSATNRKRKITKSGRIPGLRGFLLSLNVDDSHRAKKILIIFLMAMMVLGLILSGSRGGIISLSIALLVMSILLLFRSRFRRQAVGFLVVGVIALAYGLHVGMDLTIERFGRIEESSEVRMRLADTSFNILKDFPVLGTGWGTYWQAYRRYKSPPDDGLEVDHVHHDWLELGVETGFLGLGFVILCYLFCLGYFLYLWTRRQNSFSVGIGLGGIGVLTSLALHSFVDFNMHIPANALLFSIVAGVTYKALMMHHSRAENSLRKDHVKMESKKAAIYFPGWLRWPVTAGILMGFGYALLLVGKPYCAERKVTTLPDSTIQRENPSLEDVCEAISYERDNADYFYWLALLLKEEDAMPEKGCLKKVSYLFGEKIGSDQLKKEKVREENLRNDLILASLKEAIRLNPANPYYHLELGWHLISLLNEQEEEHIEHKISLAEKEFERAFYFMPESADVNFSLGYYWLWKSKVVENEKAYLESFDRFIYYFRRAYRINQEYKPKIQEIVKQYYPVEAILTRIF